MNSGAPSFFSTIGGELASAGRSMWAFVQSPIKSTVGAVAKDAGDAVGDILGGFMPTLVLLIILGIVAIVLLGRVK